MISFAKITARSANEIVCSGEPPADIQWMPAGEHKITASKNGEPAELTVQVSEEIVEALNKSLEEIKAQGFEAYLILTMMTRKHLDGFNHFSGVEKIQRLAAFVQKSSGLKTVPRQSRVDLTNVFLHHF